MRIPADIDLDSLNGPERNVSPAIFLSDDLIFWNNTADKFVLIYTIYEHSYGNNIGRIAWGRKTFNSHQILENPHYMFVVCWGGSICRWLNDDTFAIKVHIYDPDRNQSNHSRLPLVAIKFDTGIQILPSTDNIDSRASDPIELNFNFVDLNEKTYMTRMENES